MYNFLIITVPADDLVQIFPADDLAPLAAKRNEGLARTKLEFPQ